MCLKHISYINFQSFQSGLQRKKNPNGHKYAILEARFFLMFSWAKKHVTFKKIYLSVRTTKLHDVRGLKKWQYFVKLTRSFISKVWFHPCKMD